MSEDRTHRLIRYLTDSYGTEIGGQAALSDLAARTDDPDVRRLATEHAAETQSQADRLQARIQALGGNLNTATAKAAFQAAAAKASSLINLFHDQEDKQTQDLIKAYALEHFEVGVYTSLAAYSQSVGDLETAALADTIRAEEERAASRMEQLIPQVAVRALDKTDDASSSTKMPSSAGPRKLLGIPLTATTLILAPAAIALGVYGVRRLRGTSDDSVQYDNGAPSYSDVSLSGSAATGSTSLASSDDEPSVIVVETVETVSLDPMDTASDDLSGSTTSGSTTSGSTTSGSAFGTTIGTTTGTTDVSSGTSGTSSGTTSGSNPFTTSSGGSTFGTS